MEDEVEERTMSTCRVTLTQDHDRAHRHRGGDNGRTATPGLLHEPRLVDEVHQREVPLEGGEEEAQATVLTVATVEAGVALRVDREAEEDTGGDEIVMCEWELTTRRVNMSWTVSVVMRPDCSKGCLPKARPGRRLVFQNGTPHLVSSTLWSPATTIVPSFGDQSSTT